MRQNISIDEDTREDLEMISKYHSLSMSSVIAYLINKEAREIEPKGETFGYFNHKVPK